MLRQHNIQKFGFVPNNIFSKSDVNNLQQRMKDVIELLNKKNSILPQSFPSESQMKQILQHCFNCYDQLDFITLEYSKHPVNYLQPKLMAENSHKIMRISKYLLKNISHWIDSYCLQIMKQISEGHYFPSNDQPTVRCSLCKNHVQQISIRQVRNQLLGAFDLKDMFDEQLRQQKQTQKVKQSDRSKEAKQYIGSVNYLTRIIKEMEDSANQYDKLVQKMEKDGGNDDDEVPLLFLEDLIRKMTIKLGQKSKSHIMKILKDVDSKDSLKERQNIRQTATFEIKNIINIQIQPQLPKDKYPSPQDMLIKRLKQQNLKLKAEKNNLYSLQISNQLDKRQKELKENNQNQQPYQQQENIYNRERQEFIEEKILQSIKNRRTKKQFSRFSHTSKREESSSNKLEAPIEIAKIQTEGRLISNKKKNQKKLMRVSLFNVQNLAKSFRPSQLNATFNKKIDQSVDQNMPNLDSQEVEITKSLQMINKGCQWQDPSGQQKRTKNKKLSKFQIKQMNQIDNNKSRFTDNKINKGFNKNSAKLITASSQKGRKSVTKQQLVYNPSNIKGTAQSSSKYLIKQGKNNYFIKRNQKKQIQAQIKDNQKSQDFNNQGYGNKNESIENEQRQQQEQYLKSGRTKIQTLEANKREEQLKQKQRKQSLAFNKSNKASKMVRYTTEYNQSTDKRRGRKVRNVLFKPEHLSFFGGVSESYSYQKSKLQQTEEFLSDQQKIHFTNLYKYVTNLKSFKNSFFENVVAFISKPFQTIEKNQIDFKMLDDKKIYNCILKLIVYHKKRCGKAFCEHMINLGFIIGFTRPQ